jgi:hypothetical protein
MLLVCRTLERGLGCALIKSTLGSGNPGRVGNSVADPHRKNADADADADPGKNLNADADADADADPDADADADADSCPY